MDKETEQLARRLRQNGHSVGRRANNHIGVETPTGSVFLPSTPSDHRGMANNRAALRRAGIDLDSPNPFQLRRQHASAVETAAWARHIQILDLLMSSPFPITSQDLAAKAGLPHTQVYTSLQFLLRRIPGVVKVDGAYDYDPGERHEAQDCPELAALARKEHRVAMDQEPAPAGILEPLEPEEHDAAQVLIPIERRAIVCKPAAIPDNMPSMFEAIAVQRGNLVAQDENGDLWLCVPLRAAVPVDT